MLNQIATALYSGHAFFITALRMFFLTTGGQMDKCTRGKVWKLPEGVPPLIVYFSLLLFEFACLFFWIPK